MRFGSKLRLIAVLNLLSLAVVIAVMLSGQSVVSKSERNYEVLASTQERVSALGFLAHEYLLYAEPRSRDQWRLLFDTTGSELNALMGADQPPGIRELMENMDDLRLGFDRFVARTTECRAQSRLPAPDCEPLEKQLATQLMVQSQMVLESAGRAAREAYGNLTWTIEWTAIAVLATVVLLALLATPLALRMARGMVTGLHSLVSGANAFAAGRFGHRIELESQDEMGDLAGAFNHMAVARQEAESERDRSNRALRVLSECNGALVQAKEEQALLAGICRLIVEVGGYRKARIALLGDHGEVQYAAGYPFDRIRRGTTDEPGDETLLEQALKSGFPAVHSQSAALALPLRPDDRTVLGVLLISMEEETAIPAEETELLNELAADLAFGIATLRDRERKHRAEADLRLASEVLDNAVEGVMVTNTDSTIIRINRAFTKITGYSAAEAVGQPARLLRSGYHDEAFYREMWGILRKEGSWRGEVWNRRKDGTVYPEWLNISSVTGENGRVEHYVGVFSDVSERKSWEHQLFRTAHFDPLTGLPNRALLEDRAAQALAHHERGGMSLAVLFLDLDEFKQINDALGHGAGDQVLREMANRLSGQIRKTDTIARLGGDEFIILLPDLPIDETALSAEVARFADHLLQRVSRPLSIDGHEIVLTASIGAARYPQDAESWEELLRKADSAMYHAKEQGYGGYAFYADELNTAAQERIDLGAALHRALENDEFILHYQPQFSVADGRLLGVEALLRWNRPGHGLVSPARFVPLLEQSGLIMPVGEKILVEAIQQCRHWSERGLQVPRVAVNVSATQFRSGKLADVIRRELKANKVAPERLEIEVTESIIMDHLDQAELLLGELRGLGVEVAIDDFGTGYSSLAYLSRLPVDRFKIDQAFVRGIPDVPKDRAIAEIIIALAHRLGLGVIAEGVETEHQLAFLRDKGCESVQGFLLGRPMSAGAIDKTFRAKPG